MMTFDDDSKTTDSQESPEDIIGFTHNNKSKIPFIQQTSAVDCGAACLAMVLAFHGKYLSLEEVRKTVGLGRDGASLLSVIKAAEKLGMRGRGIRFELDALEMLPRGSILFWDFNHYVVFSRVRKKHVEIVDPAFGHRKVTLESFGKSFTGVAATFEPKEDFTKAAKDNRPFWRYAKQVLREKGLLRKILVISLMLQVFSLALPVFTGMYIDRVLPQSDLDLLQILSLGLGILVAFHLVSSFLRARLLVHLRTNLDMQMTMGFVEHLAGLPYAFFQMRPAGDLMMRMNSNATVREILTSTTLSSLLDGLLVCLYLVLLFLANATMAGCVLVLGFLQISLFLVTRHKQRELMSMSLVSQANLSSYQVEMLTGMETLKSMGAERRAVRHWANLFVESLNVQVSRGYLDSIFESLTGMLRMAAPLVILALGGYLVIAGDLSLGSMLAINALGLGFLTPLSTLVSSAVQLQLMTSYLERITDVMESELEQDERQETRKVELSGRIELKDVSFQYSPIAPMVIQNVSLSIEPGQKVAIVGPSGSGKSTLARLLLGLYPPVQGAILYDDINLNQMNFRDVRRQLGIVTQFPQLFSGSIRDNIAIANPEASHARVETAAKLAAIHSDIVNMPMGYETILADRGLSLSGGQRQRIALARALVHRPAIMLLDEATSSLDAITENKIHKALSQLRCTRIIIAHRLSTIKDADEILVIKGGKLIERGPYQALVSQDGYFSKLVANQLEKGLSR